MKKSLFFLFCIFLLLPGCSNDDYTGGNETKSSTNKVKWYGVNKSTSNTTRGVADEANLWNQRVGISVKFINNPANEGMIEKIKSIAKEWENYAGITFHFLESDQNADVRIAFDWNNNDYLTWSYTGTDAKLVSNQNEPTAVFGGLEYSDEEQFKGDVLRVFGQILGLEYEQRHQDWTFWKSEAQLQSYWMSMFDGLDLDWSQIKQFVFTPLTGENAIFPTQTDQIDELSIMAWPYYSRAQASKLLANFELSEGDKSFIAKLYPKENETLPTIQEAWVDAGYFEWVTKDNWNTFTWEGDDWKPFEWDKYDDGFVEGTVMLRITELGAQQEYLPDVRDGEQLTSAYRMFNVREWTAIKLKKAPKFNTSNITYFRKMFQHCSNLEEVDLFDTSKGTNFSRMFASCSSLKNVPLFDTSKGTSFFEMFSGCKTLENIPNIDTSKGVRFGGMLGGCSKMKEFPSLDTSNGTDFSYMFSSNNMETIPFLNTSKGTNLEGMFAYCPFLKSIPLLDTSKAIYLSQMFINCTALESVPLLNTSSCINFDSMFRGANSIKTIPLLNTSNGLYFGVMFEGCSSLESIPDINTSKGKDFFQMFRDCKSLAVKPNLDTSNALDNSTNAMYSGTIFQ